VPGTSQHFHADPKSNVIEVQLACAMPTIALPNLQRERIYALPKKAAENDGV